MKGIQKLAGSRLTGAAGGAVGGGILGGVAGGTLSAIRRARENERDPENRRSLADAFMTGAAKGSLAGAGIGGIAGGLSGPRIKKSIENKKRGIQEGLNEAARRAGDEAARSVDSHAKSIGRKATLGAREGLGDLPDEVIRKLEERSYNIGKNTIRGARAGAMPEFKGFRSWHARLRSRPISSRGQMDRALREMA